MFNSHLDVFLYNSLPRYAAHLMINIHHMVPSLPADGPLCIRRDPHTLTRKLYPFIHSLLDMMCLCALLRLKVSSSRAMRCSRGRYGPAGKPGASSRIQTPSW